MSSLREPSRRLPRASTASSAGASTTSRTGAIGRASVRPGVRAPSTSTRNVRLNHHSAIASRIDRSGAASPAESVSSMATTMTGGMKRKERDYEAAEVGLGEKTNINVVVRCRGRNDREVRENSAVVVSTEGVKGNVVELSMGPNALSNKSYNFDRVFSSAADQSMIFDDVVKPILDEMLSGFNCTIFAYGQTGTGKTYTMTGDMNETMGMLSDAAGIIPRVLQTLFNKLEIEESDNCVRCSFIELYNEELRDLLSADDGAKLRIYEDNAKKSTVVQGMEERHIVTAAEGIKRLQEGSLRRQVAATKCNDLSSRSHTIFTITVYVKRPGENGDDYVSAGKLNLVDLAGSENIQRSGAENKRAAEAGLINKSLLTLGRVINSLVDQGTHIPYRESKLTRLLQDSLGGRTKTCIIATISPAKSNLEETISTLDYAFRAKDIRNKPQIRTLMSKKTLLREFTAEIEKLRGELVTTRQRNGVYLSNEAYEEITVQNESRRILTEEQAAKIGTIEANLRGKVQELFDLTSSFMGLKKEHEGTRLQLDDTKELLDQTELLLSGTRKSLADETYLRKAHQETEEKLANIGSELIDTLGETVEHVSGLRAKNKRKSDLQSLNRSTWAMSQAQVADVTELVEDRISEFQKDQEDHISSVSERMQSFVKAELDKLSDTQNLLDQNLGKFEISKKELLDHKEQSKQEMDAVLEEIKVVRDHIKERVGESLEAIASAAERIAADVLSELGLFHNQLHTSFSSLGKDFKSIFEDLVKHLGAQRSESDRLRRQLEGASESLIQSNAATSARIQEIVAEERRQAAEERKQLLAQITQLINSQGETQELRLADKAALLNQDLLSSTKAFEGSVTQYSDGMGTWVEKDGRVMADINKSRENVKTKMKDDWAAANKHSTCIQATTKSVHAETVRVVEEQKRDLDVQMQDLDSFVTRARSQNSLHHSQHAASVHQLSQTVENSYAEISSHSKDAVERVRELGDEMEAEVDDIRAGLEPLDENVCQPLSNLRESIRDTLLQEYQPTGETPEKTQYTYPTELPRTAPHEMLLAGLNGGALDTPSKSAPAPPVVFSDFEETTVKRERSPSTSSAVSSGLREVNPNVSVTTSAIQFNPSASTMSLAPLSGTDNNSSTMPVYRRSTRSVSYNKDTLSKSTTGGKPPSVASGIDGRENVPPVGGFAASGRRKSPRLR
ncbi:hypothetical protein MCOR02_001943 [Pyricularia oryzae]|uniref:Kinesin motor domain-containing protein n=1 Tax=Pyricularia oryzae TaxID=318829 RepID=A0A4P7N157_PYROR|nr:hypothetical protein MCOR02_001943 [Pyricularia oryzae]KAI6311308.1 hypothetical protein MCOR34_006070 [Pyricularia oryzae]KAI6370051.1 hypothetical protein MCOR32_006463 [Pyricularia oryzae]KAI6396096.1 hypothetical protein MCOR20_010037 [Pyricularia oryzae]KAI6398082.1 hypothetical protein MCOR23_005880 [Pyricularia oryzae]